MPKLEVVNANNVIEFNPQKANFKLKNTGGPKGEPGAQGPKGDTGPQGPAGPQGIQGEKGDKGAQGERGPQGIQGPQGPQGIQGPKGDKGDNGNTGATGPQGPQGPAGQNGTDGFSPIATVTQEGLNAEISITDKDGTTTATVPGFGVQVVESLPATGSSNVIYLERDSNSASGNPISIADAVEAPLKSLEIQGNTTQQTYTGKNLINLTGVTSPSGVTGTITDGSTIKVTGTTGTNVSDNKVANLSSTIPAGTYTFTIDHAANHVINFRVNTSGGEVAFRLAPGETSVTKTLASASTAGQVFWGLLANTTYNETFKLQLVAGSTPDYDYEPYVGGIPAPNPDYPQAVQTVTGENVVKICGKNLYEWNDTEWSNPATTASWCFQDGSSTAGGGAYGPNITDRTPYKITLPAGTYKATVYNISSNIVNIQACKNGTSAEIIITSPTNMNSSNPTSTITLTEQTTLCFRYRVTNPSLGIGDTKIQVERDSATAYEPYQGQSYEVNLGKNLFDKDSGQVVNAYFDNSKISTGNSFRTAYISCEPNTTYTVSKMQSSRFAVATTTDLPANNVATSGFTQNNTATSITITTGAAAKYIVVFLYHAVYDTTLTPEQILATLQIEKGSQATSYAAYFEPIELCKIGTYQDYIYKSDGKWKIHKEVSHGIFNWDINGIAANNTSGTTTVSAEGAFSVFFLSGSISNSDRPNMRLSENIGTYNSSQQIYANGEARAMTDGTFKPRDMSGTVDRFYFRNTAYIGKTGNEVKTILVEKTGGIGLWWFFTTPTETTITNAALIAQLEAILAGGTQAGANTITLTPSAGATGTLEVEYYDSYDSYLWVNNRWEKFAHLG